MHETSVPIELLAMLKCTLSIPLSDNVIKVEMN